MSDSPQCPKCQSNHVYPDRELFICPECAHEWNPALQNEKIDNQELNVRDAFGNILKDGDSVSVIKDLKVKGSSSSVKIGTKVRNIRLVESSDGHNIDCKIEGFGNMSLKSEFVKKT
ncbi:MAG: alkylphosphonate utilization protein [Proteobacteria bacterium]|nr:alkylphosphonate utilization protein [Pseudomonadota bacterium]